MQEQYESLKFWEQATTFAQKNRWAKPLVRFCLNMIVVTGEEEEDLHPMIYKRLKYLQQSLE